MPLDKDDTAKEQLICNNWNSHKICEIIMCQNTTWLFVDCSNLGSANSNLGMLLAVTGVSKVSFTQFVYWTLVSSLKNFDTL
jgi:hypothetical protein